MNKILIGIIAFAIVVLIVKLILMDYSDLSFSTNFDTYLLASSISLIILSLFIQKQQKKKEAPAEKPAAPKA